MVNDVAIVVRMSFGLVKFWLPVVEINVIVGKSSTV